MMVLGFIRALGYVRSYPFAPAAVVAPPRRQDHGPDRTPSRNLLPIASLAPPPGGRPDPCCCPILRRRRDDPAGPARAGTGNRKSEFPGIRGSARLSAQVHDQYGDLMADAAVTWASSDASVASVDSEGLVRSVGNGEAAVTATAGSAAGSATVTVAQVVSSVGVSPAALEFSALGDTLRLAAEPVDANGHAVEGVTLPSTPTIHE